MKLYVVSGAPNARKVQAVASHLGIGLEEVFLDLFTGETKSPAYLRINPTGRVPALDDDGFILWESNAINKYLCGKVPGNTLYPGDPRMAADIDRWLSWELAHFNQQMGILGFEAVAKPQFMGGQANEALVTWSRQALAGHAAVLERHLEDREFIVGNDITLADYAMIHVEFLKDMMPFDWLPYPHVSAYFDRMRAIPHWAKTAARPEEMGRVPQGAVTFAA